MSEKEEESQNSDTEPEEQEETTKIKKKEETKNKRKTVHFFNQEDDEAHKKAKSRKNPVSQMQKSPYEKARDENVRQRKELEKELNITNLSKRLDEAEVPDAEMSLLDDSNIDTDGDAI